jgi:hypothetical protein
VADGPGALLTRLAAANRRWGAERIRGALLKLGIRVGKCPARRHMGGVRPPRPAGQGQAWATFARNHADTIWARRVVRVLGEARLRRVLRAYMSDLNTARPHQGLGQAAPDAPGRTLPSRVDAPSVALPVLGGLHHDYRRAA